MNMHRWGLGSEWAEMAWVKAGKQKTWHICGITHYIAEVMLKCQANFAATNTNLCHS